MEELYKNYIDLIRDSGAFNKILTVERKLRSPFIDAQTGIAQSDCLLWRSSGDRRCVLRQGNGALYRYPAFRWHKKRREYLLKNSTSTLHQAGELANCSANILASNNLDSPSLSQNPSNQLFNCQTANNYAPTVLAKSGTGPLQVPSRADSTGSHSCITNDSDSRDLSTATSQSFDSPAHNIEEDTTVQCNGYHSVLVNSKTADPQHIQEDHLSPPQFSELTTNSSAKINSIHGLNDQTKAAIRMHSIIQKKKKQRDAGQSLMKSCNSILVKSSNGLGTKTSNSTRIEDHQQLHFGGKPQPINHQSDSPVRTDSFQTTNRTIGSANGSRPFVCSICGQTYKTRPGLSYHFIHSHNTTLPKNGPNNSKDKERNRESPCKSPARKRTGSILERDSETSSRLTRSQLISREEIVDEKEDTEELPATDDSRQIDTKLGTRDEILVPMTAAATTTTKRANGVSEEKVRLDSPPKTNQSLTKRKYPKQNPFCDFCLGTVERNRRTKLPEELISCSGCGSSGHPSCLRFSDNIKLSAQKYDWQCIECKTCSNCNNADNEDQLLFCDDCDRSYHTYCLDPPLIELPEGNWSCHLCIIEYHSELK